MSRSQIVIRTDIFRKPLYLFPPPHPQCCCCGSIGWHEVQKVKQKEKHNNIARTRVTRKCFAISPASKPAEWDICTFIIYDLVSCYGVTKNINNFVFTTPVVRKPQFSIIIYHCQNFILAEKQDNRLAIHTSSLILQKIPTAEAKSFICDKVIPPSYSISVGLSL